MKNLATLLSFLVLLAVPAQAQKVSALNALTTPAKDDLLAIVDTSATETKKIQIEDLYVGSVNYTVCSSTGNNVVCNYTADGTDDDVEINAALQALPSAGGVVTLMDGVFTLDDAIEVPSNATLHITSGATVTGEDSYAPTCVTVNSRNVCSLIKNEDDTNGDDHIKIIVDGDVNLEGITVTYTNSWAGIHLHKTDYSLISGSGYIHHIAYGVSEEGGGNNSRYFAVFLTESDYNTIENIHGSHTGDDVFGARRSSSYNIFQNLVSHNPKYGHTYQVAGATIFGAASNATPTGNRFVGNHGHTTDETGFDEACIAAHNSYETEIRGNYCENTGSGIIVLDASRNAKIVGNTVVNPNWYGIYSWSIGGPRSGDLIASNYLVAGSASTGDGSYGIVVRPDGSNSDLSDINIVGNKVYDFGRGIGLDTEKSGSDIFNVNIVGNHVWGAVTAGYVLRSAVSSTNIYDVNITGNVASECNWGILGTNFGGGTQGSINDIYLADNVITSSVSGSTGIQIDGNHITVVGGMIDVVGTAIVESTGSNDNTFMFVKTEDSGAGYTFVGTNSAQVSFDNSAVFGITASASQPATVKLDSDTGGCLMIRDTDNGGWTQCDVLDGTMSCATDADGVCD